MTLISLNELDAKRLICGYVCSILVVKHREAKTGFLKETLENVDLHKAVLKKTMTAQEEYKKYDFIDPLTI